MRTLLAALLAAAALAAGGAAVRRASADEGGSVDIAKLQAKAKEYRHKADLLRRMVGAREAKIGQAQAQADAIMRQAQADAAARQAQAAAAQQSAQSSAQVLGLFTSMMPGGNSLAGDMFKSGVNAMGQGMVNAANAQAQQAGAEGAGMVAGAHSDSDTLMAQAQQLQGEKKKLAYKARQYEQLADSMDMHAAGEILRRRAAEQGNVLSEIDKQIESDKAFVQGMSIW